MKTKTNQAPSTQKVRRIAAGGKRAVGRQLQKSSRTLQRANPTLIRHGRPDPSLTSVAGLVTFAKYTRGRGLDAELNRLFDPLKHGLSVVYPMGLQMRTVVDANAVGEPRVFGVENLAADPLFAKLAGGSVASIDTFYRDLRRFGPVELLALEKLMVDYGLRRKRLQQHAVVHLDIDPTVVPVYGSQQGAKPGYNPRYHGRPCYISFLSAIAELRTCVGACLQAGDENFGAKDADRVASHVERVKAKLGAEQELRVRIDAAGDCTAVMGAIEDAGARFVIKARLRRELKLAIYQTKNWKTVEYDEYGKPLRQVASVSFERKAWLDAGRRVRVVAVRTREDLSGKQVILWPDLDYSVKAYLTNDFDGDEDLIAREYEDRAEVEGMIREWKYDLGIGAIPTQDFNANHAMLLLKMLTHNLVRDFVVTHMPSLATWRLAWLRRVLFLVPGRLLRPGNRQELRLSTGSVLYHINC